MGFMFRLIQHLVDREVDRPIIDDRHLKFAHH